MSTKWNRQPASILTATKLNELIKVYRDVERLLKNLRRRSESYRNTEVPIDLAKLIDRLSQSKRKLERKIGNTLLLEKEQLRRKLKRSFRISGKEQTA